MSKSRLNRKTRRVATHRNAGGHVTKQPIQIVIRKEIIRIPSRYVTRNMDVIVVDGFGTARIGSALVLNEGFAHGFAART